MKEHVEDVTLGSFNLKLCFLKEVKTIINWFPFDNSHYLNIAMFLVSSKLLNYLKEILRAPSTSLIPLTLELDVIYFVFVYLVSLMSI